jgi:hypothetical protein
MVDEIQAGLNTYDIARSIFASYCGIPATRLGMYLDGAKAWDPTDFAACQKTLRELTDLANSVAGIPIDFRKVGLVRTVLEQRRLMKTWVVRISPGQFFAGLDAAYRPVFDSIGLPLLGQAPHEICSELRKLNYKADAAQRQLLANEKSLEFRAAWKPQ